MLKLPKSKELLYRRAFERVSTDRLEVRYFRACAKLLDDTDRVCVMYDILKRRGLDSEARWQGLHALIHIKAMVSKLERLSFNQVLRRVAAKEKETDDARFGQ